MNAFLKRLGFGPDDRVVIPHADDLGMCHAANQAFRLIADQNVVRTGSVMVPAPAFDEIANYGRARASEVDLGVHITLNCEWDVHRWGPISTRDPASGLIDDEGGMWRDNASLYAHMDAHAAAAEIRAQVVRALTEGIDVTHIDTHMGSVLHPALAPAYLALAQEFRLPALIVRASGPALARMGVPSEAASMIQGAVEEAERSGGMPVFDSMADLYSPPKGNRIEDYEAKLRGLPPGLTHLVYHPALPGKEIESIADDWPTRTGDFEAFSHPRLKQALEGSGVFVLEYRTLRDEMRRKG
jgi:predicted glycoside hydrolase/deacetylase ChbG (UPF0249 family)